MLEQGQIPHPSQNPGRVRHPQKRNLRTGDVEDRATRQGVMKPKFLRHLPMWVIFAVLGTLSISSVLFYLFRKRSPLAPPALVLSVCRPLATGMHRLHSDFGIQFDVNEFYFAIRASMRDMPPGTLYVITLKGSSENLVIWRDDDIFDQLKHAFPVFSEQVEGRDILNTLGEVVGRDRWGFLKDGERWRYVTFAAGDAVGYHPISPNEARLLDQVIGSACVSPGPQGSSVQ